jgi:hypothetical protein
MYAGANVNPELADGLTDTGRAPNRPRRAIKRRQEPIACGIYLVPAKSGQLLAHQCVVTIEEIPPASVS